MATEARLNGRNRYTVPAVALASMAAIACQPRLLTPLGRAYMAICVDVLEGVPLRHHFPPLLVAFAAPVLLALVVGVLVALVRQLASQRRLAAALAARQVELGDELGRLVTRLGAHGRVVRTTDTAVYAFCGGLARPRVYLSGGLLALLSGAELEAVVRHELHHLGRRDPLRLFLSNLLDGLALLFPALATLAERIRVNAELDADRAAVTVVGVTPLASALIKVMRAPAMLETHALLAAWSATSARAAALAGHPIELPLERRDLCVSLGVALSVAALLTWLALQPLALPAACQWCLVR